MKLKPVEVEWIDAQSSLDIVSTMDLKDCEVVSTISCGYLVYEDKEKIILAFMLFDGDLMKHYQIIPKEMVRKIRRLK